MIETQGINLKELSTEMKYRLNLIMSQGSNPYSAQKEILKARSLFADAWYNQVSLRDFYRGLHNSLDIDFKNLTEEDLIQFREELRTEAEKNNIDISEAKPEEHLKSIMSVVGDTIEDAKLEESKTSSRFRSVIGRNYDMASLISDAEREEHVKRMKKEINDLDEDQIKSISAELQGKKVEDVQEESLQSHYNRVINKALAEAQRNELEEGINSAMAQKDRNQINDFGVEEIDEIADRLFNQGSITQNEYDELKSTKKLSTGLPPHTFSNAYTMAASNPNNPNYTIPGQSRAIPVDSPISPAGGGGGNRPPNNPPAPPGGPNPPGGGGGNNKNVFNYNTFNYNEFYNNKFHGTGPGGSGTGQTAPSPAQPMGQQGQPTPPNQPPAPSPNFMDDPMAWLKARADKYEKDFKGNNLDLNSLLFLSDFGLGAVGDNNNSIADSAGGLIRGTTSFGSRALPSIVPALGGTAVGGLLAGGAVGVGGAGAGLAYQQYMQFADHQRSVEALTGEDKSLGLGAFAEERLDFGSDVEAGSLTNERLQARLNNLLLSGQEIENLSEEILKLGGSAEEAAEIIGASADAMQDYAFLSAETIAQVNLETSRTAGSPVGAEVLGQIYSDIAKNSSVSGETIAQAGQSFSEITPTSPMAGRVVGGAVAGFLGGGSHEGNMFFDEAGAEPLAGAVSAISTNMSLQMMYGLTGTEDLSTEEGVSQILGRIEDRFMPDLESMVASGTLETEERQGKTQIAQTTGNLSTITMKMPGILPGLESYIPADYLIEYYNAHTFQGQGVEEAVEKEAAKVDPTVGKEKFKQNVTGDWVDKIPGWLSLGGSNENFRALGLGRGNKDQQWEKIKDTDIGQLISQDDFNVREGGRMSLEDATDNELRWAAENTGLKQEKEDIGDVNLEEYSDEEKVKLERALFIRNLSQGDIEGSDELTVYGPEGKKRQLSVSKLLESSQRDENNVYTDKQGRLRVDDPAAFQKEQGAGEQVIDLSPSAKKLFVLRDINDPDSIPGKVAKAYNELFLNRGERELNGKPKGR